jgi:hypothetical protein
VRTPALITVLLVLLAGCGGDDRPTAEDYAKAGNAACERATTRAQAVERPQGDSAKAVADYAAAVGPIARERLAALRKLEPPDELERFHERLLLEQERLVAAIATVQDAARRDDRATAERAATEGAQASTRSKLLERRLGLGACESSPL